MMACWKFRVPPFLLTIAPALAGMAVQIFDPRRGALELGWIEAQYYVNYQSFGFVKRGIVGTVLKLLNVELNSVTIICYAVGVLLLLALLFTRFALYDAPDRNAGVRLTVFQIALLSPAVFLQLGYDVARYDAINLCLLLIALRQVRRKSTWVPAVLCSIGILIHENFVLIGWPMLIAAVLDGREGPLAGQGLGRQLELLSGMRRGLGYWPLILLPAVTCAMVVCFGRFEPGEGEFVARMVGRVSSPESMLYSSLPSAARVWTWTVGENLLITWRRYRNPVEWCELLVLAAFMATYARYYLKHFGVTLLTLSPFAGLALFGLGVDFYRWGALIITNQFIVALHILKTEQVDRGDAFALLWARKRAVWLALLGPLGIKTIFPLITEIGMPIARRMIAF